MRIHASLVCTTVHVCNIVHKCITCICTIYKCLLFTGDIGLNYRGSLAEDVLVSELEKKPLSQLALNTKLPTPTEENAELAQKKDSPTMNESPKVLAT
jgi:hypothetical protein